MGSQRTVEDIFRECISIHQLALTRLADPVRAAVDVMIAALKSEKKILVFGNGGSAADSQHMAAEMVGRFQKERVSIPVLALTTDTSIMTAVSNDYGFDTIFSRQIEAFGRPGDVALGISTSGNSANVIRAMECARLQGMKTVALTGEGGGRLRGIADICIAAPATVTARVQELHIVVIHILCELIEEQFC